jgi:FkbM family methyltransferase
VPLTLTRASLRQVVPLSLRETRYKLKRLGIAKFIRYHRIESRERRKPPPQAGSSFDIGGAHFVLHESTIAAVRSHWVEYGHGILELKAFKRVAHAHDMLLDIGAAEGIYSACFCALTGRSAWAFEPSREKFPNLEDLCHLNPDLAIHPVNIAVDANAGERAFRRYPDGQFSGVGATPENSELLPVTTIDAFVADRQLLPDFAKIDVEGMELDVLRGGERTFRDLIKTIVLEVHYAELENQDQSNMQLQALLEGYGFCLESLDGLRIQDLERFTQAQPEPIPGYTIIICRKPER